jgi:hypothetical protein
MGIYPSSHKARDTAAANRYFCAANLGSVLLRSLTVKQKLKA